MNKKILTFIAIMTFLVIGTANIVLALENDITTSSGIEFVDYITLASSVLAIILFVITIIAYKRDGRKKILYVSVAFFLFAVKGFLISSDIILQNKSAWIDPIATILDFAILLSFFAGLLKK